MKIFESIMNHKINTITGEELMKYASQFQINITAKQAEKIAQYLRNKKVNIFEPKERAALVKEIAKIAGPETAKEVNKLFIQFTKQN
jgi:TRAP-type C4-dicarboxylate transport system substrate-binding protein